MHVPTVETERLLVRPFVMEDLEAIHQILDVELNDGDNEEVFPIEQREEWLRWSVLNNRQLEWLVQPPFGDRAVVLKESGELIGACGYAPTLDAFGQLALFGGEAGGPVPAFTSVEVGLYYAFSPRFHGKGYATEAARALVDYGFQHLRLHRIIATTAFENIPSRRVMERLGMQIEENPYPEPPWLQVVGVLLNPVARDQRPETRDQTTTTTDDDRRPTTADGNDKPFNVGTCQRSNVPFPCTMHHAPFSNLQLSQLT
jgi:RimJ/RimL family protein N-acetyltransferase